MSKKSKNYLKILIIVLSIIILLNILLVVFQIPVYEKKMEVNIIDGRKKVSEYVLNIQINLVVENTLFTETLTKYSLITDLIDKNHWRYYDSYKIELLVFPIVSESFLYGSAASLLNGANEFCLILQMKEMAGLDKEKTIQHLKKVYHYFKNEDSESINQFIMEYQDF